MEKHIQSGRLKFVLLGLNCRISEEHRSAQSDDPVSSLCHTEDDAQSAQQFRVLTYRHFLIKETS